MSSKGKPKGRRLIFGLVIVPLALAVIYYAFFAADRFVSSAQVVVREEGSNAASAMPGLSTLLTGANPASREETLYLRQFITSNDMMQVLQERLQWAEHYREQRSDVFFLLRNGASREDLLKFYQRMVVATYDETTGLLTVQVQALTPEMSKRMLTTILAVSENFVNEMSHGIAREQMKFAKAELESARNNYEVRKEQLLIFQNTNKVLDGDTSAQSRATIISGLEAEYSKQQAIIIEMQYKLRANAPQVMQQQSKVSALRAQLAAEKRLLVSSPDGEQANVIASRYQQLVLDAGIAEASYTATVGALESARVEASKKIRTLVTVVTPNTPEAALYPERLYNLATILLALLMLYGIARFLIASIEDHRD